MILIICIDPTRGQNTPGALMIPNRARPECSPVYVEFRDCAVEAVLTEAACTAGADRESYSIRPVGIPGHSPLLTSAMRACREGCLEKSLESSPRWSLSEVLYHRSGNPRPGHKCGVPCPRQELVICVLKHLCGHESRDEYWPYMAAITFSVALSCFTPSGPRPAQLISAGSAKPRHWFALAPPLQNGSRLVIRPRLTMCRRSYQVQW